MASKGFFFSSGLTLTVELFCRLAVVSFKVDMDYTWASGMVIVVSIWFDSKF